MLFKDVPRRIFKLKSCKRISRVVAGTCSYNALLWKTIFAFLYNAIVFLSFFEKLSIFQSALSEKLIHFLLPLCR